MTTHCLVPDRPRPQRDGLLDETGVGIPILPIDDLAFRELVQPGRCYAQVGERPSVLQPLSDKMLLVASWWAEPSHHAGAPLTNARWTRVSIVIPPGAA